MNGTAPKVEILAPLSKAMELTRRILLQPFNLEKWLVIGFAAFLSHLGGGGRLNINMPWGRSYDYRWPHGISGPAPGWLWPALFVGLPIGLAVIVLLIWLGARGRFIFTDCIVRDRAAIIAPWHEFAPEGNSFFVFSLAVAVILLALFSVGLLPFILPALLHRHGANISLTVGAVFWIALLAIVAVAWWMISQLIVPVMYRQRCRAWSAFQQVLNLIATHAAEVILFIVFYIVLSIALAMLVFIGGILTCCVGFCLIVLPYVGTVILLPLEVLLFGYTLLFLRQFGSEFDVWATVQPSTAATVLAPPTPPTPRPSPETPPSAGAPPRSPYEPPEPPPQA